MSRARNLEIYKKVAEEFGYSPAFIRKVHGHFFKYMKGLVGEQELRSIKTNEELLKVRQRFRIPFIGTLFIYYGQVKRINNAKDKKYKTSFQQDSDNL
jgi:hypothetical protein